MPFDSDPFAPVSAPARSTLLPGDDYTTALEPWLRRGAQGTLPEYDPSLSFLFDAPDVGPSEPESTEQIIRDYPITPGTPEQGQAWADAQPDSPSALFDAEVAADEDARLRKLGIRDNVKPPLADHLSGAAIIARAGTQGPFQVPGAYAAMGTPQGDPFGHLNNRLRSDLVAQYTATDPALGTGKARVNPDYSNTLPRREWAEDVSPEFLQALGIGGEPVLVGDDRIVPIARMEKKA